ncbi:MAG: alpha/beta hydrolase, partial [Kangiellaceae bacterium]|nr:alpha/beta hydrolase [Kangiellaceae bacterium]
FGDTDYIGQLEDDLADLVSKLTKKQGYELVVGGHSAGSLIALRYINKYSCGQLSGYFTIAPPLTQSHETRKYDLDGNNWQFLLRYFRNKPYYRDMPLQSQKFLPRLSIFKYIVAGWLPWLRHKTVMTFPTIGNSDINKRGGYSFNLLSSYGIANYPDAFSEITVPCSFVIGEHDDVISPDILECIFNWYLSPYISKKFKLVPKANHISVITSASLAIAEWAESILIEGKEATA